MSGITPDGLVLVDKPGGLTSHDVVARVRRLASTRKVGHAGTLDPMATGLLVVGVGRATRLLGHLTTDVKEYSATIRLGVATTTDDAEGEPLPARSASAAAIDDAAVHDGVASLRGLIDQVPSSVSAVKVDGQRAYARVRSGEEVRLAPRQVTIGRFDVSTIRRPEPALVDVDVVVECSAGTYVRALARDLGDALGVGGHLTALRRTRSGRFSVTSARTLDQLSEELQVVPLSAAVAEGFPRRECDDEEAVAVAHGRPLPWAGETGPVGVFAVDGAVLALMAPRDGLLRPLVVFVG